MKKFSILSISFLLAFGLCAGLASANASGAKEAKALDPTNFVSLGGDITRDQWSISNLFDGDLSTGVNFSKDSASDAYIAFAKNVEHSVSFAVESIDVYFPSTANVWKQARIRCTEVGADSRTEFYRWNIEPVETADYKKITINLQGLNIETYSLDIMFEGEAGARGAIQEVVVHETADASLPTYHFDVETLTKAKTDYCVANLFDNNDETSVQFKTNASGTDSDIIIDLPSATTVRDVKVAWAAGIYRRPADANIYYSTDNGTSWANFQEETESCRVSSDDTSSCVHNRMIYQRQTPVANVTNLKYEFASVSGWYTVSEFAYNVTSENDPIVSITNGLKNYQGQFYNIVDGDETTSCWFNGRPASEGYVSLDYPNAVTANCADFKMGNNSNGDTFAGKIVVKQSNGSWVEVATYDATTNNLKLRFPSTYDIVSVHIIPEAEGGWIAIKHFELRNDPRECTISLGGGYDPAEAIRDPFNDSKALTTPYLYNMIDGDKNTITRLTNPSTVNGRLYFEFPSSREFTSLVLESTDPNSTVYNTGEWVKAIAVYYFKTGEGYVKYGDFAANDVTHVITASFMNAPFTTTGIYVEFTWTFNWIGIQEITFNAPLSSYYVGNWTLPAVNYYQNFSHMTDGDYDTGVWFDYKIDYGAYIVLDLQETKRINDIVLFQKGNTTTGGGDAKPTTYSNDYLEKCRFDYSSDGKKWTAFNDGSFEEVANIFFKPNQLVNARYIRVVNLDDSLDGQSAHGAVIREFRVNTTDDLIDAIMNSVTCDGTGETAPSGWSSIEAPYNALDEGIQNELKTAVTVKNGDNLLDNALEKYDYVMSKYGSGTYSNYLDRAISPSYSGYFFNTILGSKESNGVILVIVISAVTLSGIAAFFLLRRKREN